MQFSVLVLALAASVTAQTINNAVINNSANGNTNSTVNVDADAYSGTAGDKAPAASHPEYPYPGGSKPYDPKHPECVSIYTHPGTKTITDLTVSTYCAVCDDAKVKGKVYTTTYATVYPTPCPSKGLCDVTYTVTQTCTGTTPIDHATPAPGYEVVTKVCDTCPDSPTYTYTTPACGEACAATATPDKPAATPNPTGKGAAPSAAIYKGAASTVAISAFAGVAALSFFGMLLL